MPYYRNNLGAVEHEALAWATAAVMFGPLLWIPALVRTGAAARKASKHAKAALILMMGRFQQVVGAEMELGVEIQRSAFLLNQAGVLEQQAIAAVEAAPQAAAPQAAPLVEEPATSGISGIRCRIRSRS